MTGSPIFTVHFRLTFLHQHMIVWFSWIISICEIHGEYRTAGHLVFWKPWPAVELKKVLSVTKHGFIFWDLKFWARRKPNATLARYIKHFRIAWPFLIDIWYFRSAGIFRFCEIYGEHRTAGHLVFWKPWPAVELKKVKCHKPWFRLLSPAWTKRYSWDL